MDDHFRIGIAEQSKTIERGVVTCGHLYILTIKEELINICYLIGNCYV